MVGDFLVRCVRPGHHSGTDRNVDSPARPDLALILILTLVRGPSRAPGPRRGDLLAQRATRAIAKGAGENP